MMLGIRHQQAKGAEHARQRRDDDARDPQFGGNPSGEQRPVAAKRQHGELTGIAPPLHRHRPNGAHHRGRCQPQHTMRGFLHGQAHRRCQITLDGGAGGVQIEAHGAAGQAAGVQISQRQIAVGDRRRGAAAAIANRAGRRAGAFRSDLWRAGTIQATDGAAAGADLGQIDGRQF